MPYFNHVNGNGDSDNGTSPLAGLGLSAKLTDLLDLQARYRYIWDLGDDQKTWKTDMSVATLELVMHPEPQSLCSTCGSPGSRAGSRARHGRQELRPELRRAVCLRQVHPEAGRKPRRSTPCISRLSTSSRKTAAPWWWVTLTASAPTPIT